MPIQRGAAFVSQALFDVIHVSGCLLQRVEIAHRKRDRFTDVSACFQQVRVSVSVEFGRANFDIAPWVANLGAICLLAIQAPIGVVLLLRTFRRAFSLIQSPGVCRLLHSSFERIGEA